jgi:hypothetical protein
MMRRVSRRSASEGEGSPLGALALDVDLVDAVQKIEVVQIGGPQVALKGIEDRAERHTERLGFPAVDVQIELGRLRTESGERVYDPRLSYCFADQSVGGRLQSGQAALAHLSIISHCTVLSARV